MERYLSDFEALFHRYYSYLCTTATLVLHDPDLAEDIVQEFYIEHWNKNKPLEAAAFKAYAKRAITNDCIDYLRKQKTNAQRHETIITEELHDPAQEAEALEASQNQYQRILDLVDELPKDRKAILILHAVEQMSYAQIADRQGISINTVKTQLSRAYKSLRIRGSIILTYIIKKLIT